MFTNFLKQRNRVMESTHGFSTVSLSGWFNSDMVAVIGEDRVTKGQNWDKAVFISDMKDRGFSVEYYCEDRPCGNCYFKISIPEQER